MREMHKEMGRPMNHRVITADSFEKLLNLSEFCKSLVLSCYQHYCGRTVIDNKLRENLNYLSVMWIPLMYTVTATRFSTAFSISET